MSARWPLLALASTGLVIWWPGIKTWRRNLTLHRGVGWKRLIWDLHSMIGFWSFGFILVFAVSGLYLAIPQPFEDLAGRLEPVLGDGDRVIYWLAILHFGRINGIGFPCGGPGICDQATKADLGDIWAGPCGDVHHRRDHVVEPGAASTLASAGPASSFRRCDYA